MLLYFPRYKNGLGRDRIEEEENIIKGESQFWGFISPQMYWGLERGFLGLVGVIRTFILALEIHGWMLRQS
jgi:hypothetical protein